MPKLVIYPFVTGIHGPRWAHISFDALQLTEAKLRKSFCYNSFVALQLPDAKLRKSATRNADFDMGLDRAHRNAATERISYKL